MAQVSYPGVYIQEVPSGVRTITSVGTSITAFVDFFAEGPMDVATEIFGMSDFARTFGGLHAKSEASQALGQFFLNGGSSAIVVRNHATSVANPLAAASVDVLQAGAATLAVTFTAASPGLWGNTLRVAIDHRTADPSRFFNLTITRYASDTLTAAAIGQESFLNVTLDPSGSRDVVKVLAADSHWLVATVPAAATAALPAPSILAKTGLPAAI